MLTKFNEIRARRARGEDTGFSLIELLVVVVIMGILIAIAIPVYLNYQEGAKKKSVESDVRNAIPAVEQCIADNQGAWSEDCESTTIDAKIETTNDNTVTVAAGSTAGTYTIEGEGGDVDWFACYNSADSGQVTGNASGC